MTFCTFIAEHKTACDYTKKPSLLIVAPPLDDGRQLQYEPRGVCLGPRSTRTENGWSWWYGPSRRCPWQREETSPTSWALSISWRLTTYATCISLHHLLPPERKYSNLRNRGHPYELPEYCTNLHKKSFIIQSLYLYIWFFLFFNFVSCLLTVTLHIVDVRLTCLINITYLLVYIRPHRDTTLCDKCVLTNGKETKNPILLNVRNMKNGSTVHRAVRWVLAAVSGHKELRKSWSFEPRVENCWNYWLW